MRCATDRGSSGLEARAHISASCATTRTLCRSCRVKIGDLPCLAQPYAAVREKQVLCVRHG